MLFREQKNGEGWRYDIDDIFGSASIESNLQLDADMLDAIIMVIMKHEPGAIEVNGSVQVSDTQSITYQLKRTPMWSDDEPEPCENSPTSTKKQEKEPTPTLPLVTRALNWSRRFVAAFLEAWRKS
jgi:hypothetical protein